MAHRKFRALALAALALTPLARAAAQEAGEERLPLFLVREDDTRIGRSCRLTFLPGSPVRDLNGDGVVHVVADGVRIEFEPGAELWGAPKETPPDELSGVGIRVQGHKDVRITGARIGGFKAAIFATDADGLTVFDCDLADNFRQRLRSTPKAEDGADWLWPHENDANQWLERYGAALYVEDSEGVTIRYNRVRRGQNGIVLDRVSGSKVYDNDASFLSGWGLAMWRACDNVVDHNAFDFCVRGYSHGVYNRGQDSAGLLMFEQCSRNVVADNSITHGGDGIFAFAGREALGEGAVPEGFEHERAGNDDNQFLRNDLSFAAAHGLELTFSFGNLIEGNLFEANAICGVWGGYSQDTTIQGNRFVANGDAGYGLERGGVNVEHGADNRILENRFERNACGVHLWWDPDEGLAKLPWARANGVACADNRVLANRFDGDALAIHLRAAERTRVHGNVFEDVGEELRAVESEVLRGPDDEALLQGALREASPSLRGASRPVGARPALRGREHIVMTEWGPWDHSSPLVRWAGADRGVVPTGTATSLWFCLDHYELLAFDATPEATVVAGDVSLLMLPAGKGGPALSVTTTQVGLVPYVVRLEGGGLPQPVELRGLMSNFDWRARFFAWSTDPREDAEAWRAEADNGAVAMQLDALELPYGGGGPAQLGLGAPLDGSGLPPDRFGTLASATVRVPAGRWRIVTLSDDGIRVRADGELVIDDWTWHAPTRHEALLELAEPRDVLLEVEHFELDGHAVLSLQIERAE